MITGLAHTKIVIALHFYSCYNIDRLTNYGVYMLSFLKERFKVIGLVTFTLMGTYLTMTLVLLLLKLMGM